MYHSYTPQKMELVAAEQSQRNTTVKSIVECLVLNVLLFLQKKQNILNIQFKKVFFSY